MSWPAEQLLISIEVCCMELVNWELCGKFVDLFQRNSRWFDYN